MSSVPDRTLSTVLGLIAIVLWSTSVAFGRSLSEQLGPLTSACLIYLLGGLLGCSYQALIGRLGALKSLDPRYLFGCGGLFVLYTACLYLALGLALNRSQVLEVGLMNYLWPTLTVLLSVPILKKKATMALIPGVILATTGAVVGTTQHQSLSAYTERGASFATNLSHNALPHLLGVTAAVSWALYSTLSRKWAGDAETGAVCLFMLSTGLVLGLARLLVPEDIRWRGRAPAELLYMVIGSNLAYAFWERAMRRGDIILVATCSYLTPLLSTLVSTFYLGTMAGTPLWIGCALVIVGATVSRLAIKEGCTTQRA